MNPATLKFINYAVLCICGYLLGCIHFCRIVPLIFRKTDICKISPDNNPGAANVFTYCGWKMGLACLFLDLAKGFLPVFIIVKWMDPLYFMTVPVMVLTVLGHAFSVFNRFRGGKCISVFFGELIALLWITPVGLILAGLYIIFSVLVKINPHRKRSIIAYSVYIPAALVLEFLTGRMWIGIACALCSGIVILKHLISKD